MEKGIILVMIFAMVLLVFPSVYAITASIGNAKMILYPEVGFWGTTIEKSILVSNVNNISVNISLKAEGNFSDMVEIIDKNFILQPNEEKKAQFSIKIKKPGDYSGKINVFFSAIGEKSPGVVLSSTMIIHATKSGSDSGDESETDTNEDENIEEDNTNAGVVSLFNGNEGKISPLLIVVIITTVIAIAFLIWLFIMLNKRLKKKKREGIKIRKIKVKRKRSGRSS